jgi:hypothetical protein
VAPRARVLSFGSAAAVVVAGAVCGLVVDGTAGEAAAIGLMMLGLGAVVLLLFLEVGLSEDRERAEDARERRRGLVHPRRRLRLPRRPRRP